jgi:PleD family two-component response regulator
MFQETRRLSITDSLTGLHNTRYFYRALDLEIARTNRYGTPFRSCYLTLIISNS